MTFRTPRLTVAVFVVTLAVTMAQLVWPEVLPALRRQPSMIAEGEVWRFASAWLVHDEGVRQIAFNLTALAIAGTLVEIMLGGVAWVIAYAGAGLAGEIAGIFWQPVGAGNSVAVCGLVGALAAWQAMRRDIPVVARLVFPLVYFAGALVLVANSDIHGPPLLIGGAVGWASKRLGGKRRDGLG